jgi:hypothetical protein
MDEVDPRPAQAGSPIALALFYLLADPTSTLRSLLRVSDLFCVRLTCKEAWRSIQHQPLTRRGVLKAVTDRRGYGHHVPLLRWCLRNGIVNLDVNKKYFETIGEAGDIELVTEFLTRKRKSHEMLRRLLLGAGMAGHDELALQLVAIYEKLPGNINYGRTMMKFIASGGCVRTAAAIDDDPTAWVDYLPDALSNGHKRFVQWVLADVKPDPHAPYIIKAAQSGSLELVKWLYAKGYKVKSAPVTRAAESGNVGLCKWLLDHGRFFLWQVAMKAAVRGGHVHVLEWLSTQGGSCDSELLCYAVRKGGVPVVAWCLDHHPHPADAGDLLLHSCRSMKGSEVFEYLVSQRGFQSSPKELMGAVADRNRGRQAGRFDAAVLVKRYGTPLYSGYLWDAIHRHDVGRLRFALAQGQEVSVECYEKLFDTTDPAMLNEVLLARKQGDSIPEADQARIRKVLLRRFRCSSNMLKVLMDHSVVI